MSQTPLQNDYKIGDSPYFITGKCYQSRSTDSHGSTEGSGVAGLMDWG